MTPDNITLDRWAADDLSTSNPGSLSSPPLSSLSLDDKGGEEREPGLEVSFSAPSKEKYSWGQLLEAWLALTVG